MSQKWYRDEKLNRPEKRNAINDEMRNAIIDMLLELNIEDTVKAVVITGAGTVFCAGGDIGGMRERLKAPRGKVGFNGWSDKANASPYCNGS